MDTSAALQIPPERRAAAHEKAATREKIVRAARELVVANGYDAVSTADITARSGVSRGGLYHHFDSKSAVFAAVVDAIERDFMERLAAAVAGEPDPISALRNGAQWYLDECAASVELQRAGLTEGRKALGWETWRATIEPHGMVILTATLEAAMESGRLKRLDATMLAQVLLAALIEAAAVIVSASDRSGARAQAGAIVDAVIGGLAKS